MNTEEMNRKEMDTSREAARTILYQFLALAFYEPTADLLEDFQKADNAKQLLVASDVLLGSEGNKVMVEFLKLVNIAVANKEEALPELRAEYTRLFLGPMTPTCPPYESVFDKERSEENWGTMAGPSTDAMDKALADEGLEITLEFAELSDHAAIELEYMYYLLSRGYFGEDNKEAFIKKANVFLVEHLAKWLPEFGVLVSVKSNHSFYRAVGLFLEKMIKADLENSINNHD
jgi:TorA maturation chaperone TorD